MVDIAISRNIFLASENKLYALDFYGNIIWIKNFEENIYSIGIGKINKSSITYFIVVITSKKIYALSEDTGKILWSIEHRIAKYSQPSIYDLNSDGADEIVINIENGHYLIISSNGNIIKKIKAKYSKATPALIADVDLDKIPEVILISVKGSTTITSRLGIELFSIEDNSLVDIYSSKNISYYIINKEFMYPSLVNRTSSQATATVSTGLIDDLNRDGVPNIIWSEVQGGLRFKRSGYIYIYDFNKRKFIKTTWKNHFVPLVLYDFNGDGISDILNSEESHFLTGKLKNVYIISGKTQEIIWKNKIGELASVAVGDLDNNELPDLVIIENKGNRSYIKVYESKKTSKFAGWSHIRADAQRSNSYENAYLFSLCNKEIVQGDCTYSIVKVNTQETSEAKNTSKNIKTSKYEVSKSQQNIAYNISLKNFNKLHIKENQTNTSLDNLYNLKKTRIEKENCVKPDPDHYLFGVFVYDYWEISKLDYVKNDKELIYNLATCYMGVPKENILLLENPSYAYLKKQLRKFTRKIRKKDAILYFYYSGHGIMDSQGKFYILPVDASIEDENSLKESAINIDLLNKLLTKAKGKKIAFIDACRIQPTWKPAILAYKPNSSNIAFIFSTKEGQSSNVDKDRKYSAFTRALYEMAKSGIVNLDFDDDGYVEIGELIKPLIKWMKRVSADEKQTPDVWGPKDFEVFPVE